METQKSLGEREVQTQFLHQSDPGPRSFWLALELQRSCFCLRMRLLKANQLNKRRVRLPFSTL